MIVKTSLRAVVTSVNSIGVVFSQDGVELECVPRYYVYNVILGWGGN